MSQPNCRKRCTHSICAHSKHVLINNFSWKRGKGGERERERERANERWEQNVVTHIIYIKTHKHTNTYTNFKSNLNILQVLTLNSLRYRHFILFLLLVLLAVLQLRMWENFRELYVCDSSQRWWRMYVHDNGSVGAAVWIAQTKFSQMINNLTSPFNILHNYKGDAEQIEFLSVKQMKMITFNDF